MIFNGPLNGGNRTHSKYWGERGRDTTCVNDTPAGHNPACECFRVAATARVLGGAVKDQAKFVAWMRGRK